MRDFWRARGNGVSAYMRVKKVNRYYCEFCKKSNCSASHMSKHERHCTMNPSRECGMCKLLDNKQASILSMIVLLPDPAGMSYGSENSIEKALEALRKVAGDCPACIMAALRQRGIPVPAVEGFNYTEECKAAWSEFNEAQAQEELMEARNGYSPF